MSIVIALRGATSIETPAPLRPPPPIARSRSLSGAARRLWHRWRQFVEAVGWIVLVASIIAAIR